MPKIIQGGEGFYNSSKPGIFKQVLTEEYFVQTITKRYEQIKTHQDGAAVLEGGIQAPIPAVAPYP